MLRLWPVTLDEAKAFIRQYHRSHKPPTGHKVSTSVRDRDGTTRGVAVLSRPVSRELDKRNVAEVTRVCTDGAKNACSMLYAACARIAQGLGYDEVVTYIKESEPGTSLRAAGWTCDGVIRRDGKGWDSRQGRLIENTERKVRYRKRLQRIDAALSGAEEKGEPDGAEDQRSG